MMSRRRNKDVFSRASFEESIDMYQCGAITHNAPKRIIPCTSSSRMSYDETPEGEESKIPSRSGPGEFQTWYIYKQFFDNKNSGRDTYHLEREVPLHVRNQIEQTKHEFNARMNRLDALDNKQQNIDIDSLPSLDPVINAPNDIIDSRPFSVIIAEKELKSKKFQTQINSRPSSNNWFYVKWPWIDQPLHSGYAKLLDSIPDKLGKYELLCHFDPQPPFVHRLFVIPIESVLCQLTIPLSYYLIPLTLKENLLWIIKHDILIAFVHQKSEQLGRFVLWNVDIPLDFYLNRWSLPHTILTC